MAFQPARRFWTEAQVTELRDGYGVALDQAALKTRRGAELVLPTRELAELVCQEWQGQDDTIDPLGFSMTNRAFHAGDLTDTERDALIAALANYADSDLVCYRATHPQELVNRQAVAWDPLLDWASDEFGGRLAVTSGVVHVGQDTRLLENLAGPVHEMSAYDLAGFNELVTLPGSLVVALAAISGGFEIGDLWARANVDEVWQEENWGIDDEATERNAQRKQSFLQAHAFFHASRRRIPRIADSKAHSTKHDP